ncbi:SGT1 protein-domain-containing protein [Pelagophyceae sp. CCMP2097]|nr:SGT1 protein-domain-containing protein [Pelagophyceae sp. CCMP2097]
MFDGAAGPRLEDFVSLNPEDLATFSSERELAEEDELVFQIFDDLNRPLETLRDSVAAKAEALAGEHAWHDLEAFRKLKCVVATDETPAHVRGSVGLGLSDNLDDEWLAVAVLFEMTRADGAVAVSCVDGDGEFLLVDAADALPDWLEPDTAGKRAWLRRGAVAVVLDGPPRALPCDRALALLRGGGAAKNEAAQLATSALVHRCGLDARGGLSFAPAAALAMRARVVLPRKALECFLAEPRLVTVA